GTEARAAIDTADGVAVRRDDDVVRVGVVANDVGNLDELVADVAFRIGLRSGRRRVVVRSRKGRRRVCDIRLRAAVRSVILGNGVQPAAVGKRGKELRYI